MPAKKTPRRPARPRRDSNSPPLYAAVDLGSNNCRLLVAEPRGTGFRVVDSYSQIARLGEGLNETGRLSDASIARAMQALTRIRSKLKARRVGYVRCIATEACRKARNGQAFIERVRHKTGLTFRIIGPQEEARLAVIGCHDLIAEDASTVLVIDAGGGSTELSWVDAEAVRENGLAGLLTKVPLQAWTSLKLGVVTLSEAHAHLPEAEAYPAMLDQVRSVFSKWDQRQALTEALGSSGSHLIGTSGTVTCLAGLHLGLDRYRRDKVDGAWLSRDETLAAIRYLRSLGVEARARLPVIGQDRARLILSGCAIIEAIWELLPPERLHVADRGLREGLLLSMMHGPRKPRRRRGGRRPGRISGEAHPYD